MERSPAWSADRSKLPRIVASFPGAGRAAGPSFAPSGCGSGSRTASDAVGRVTGWRPFEHRNDVRVH